MLLGSGGTDGSGNFVQGGVLGIVLSQPLVEGEKIFAVDTRTGLSSPLVTVQPAPVIPDVSPWGAATLTGLLLLAILVRLRAAGLSPWRSRRG